MYSIGSNTLSARRILTQFLDPIPLSNESTSLSSLTSKRVSVPTGRLRGYWDQMNRLIAPQQVASQNRQRRRWYFGPSGLTGVRSLPPQFERQPRRVRKGDCYACTCHSESSRDIIRRGESNTPFTTPRESTLVDILGESTVSDPHDQTLV